MGLPIGVLAESRIRNNEWEENNTEEIVNNFINFVSEINNYGSIEQKIKLVERIACCDSLDELPVTRLDLV